MDFRIQSSSGIPITRQLVDQIRAQCASGVLQPGQRMPSVRELATQLAINQNTVLRVYERLTAQGLLQRRHGSGTFVSERQPRGEMRQQMQVLGEELDRIVVRARTVGVELDRLHRMLDEAWDAAPEPAPAAANEQEKQR